MCATAHPGGTAAGWSHANAAGFEAPPRVTGAGPVVAASSWSVLVAGWALLPQPDTSAAARTTSAIDRMNDIVRVDGMMARNLPAAGRDTIGQTSTGGVAVALTRRREPDVVLMDVPTPDLDGIAATGRV